MTKLISTPSRTKEILERYNLSAKKNFGQNFLVDPVIVQRCAELLPVDCAVIEIGPGIGSLTETLAMHCTKVIAYEIDESLKPVLADTLSPYDNVEIRFQDFLTVDLNAVVKDLKDRFGQVCVCANLPYYITSPVLFKIFGCSVDIPILVTMMQKEVGERFAAAPGDADYSALSVEGQYLYDIKKVFTVPGRSFNPSPKVESVVLCFKRKDNARVDEEFFVFLRACFKQRRKTIYNNLREYLEDGEKAKDILARAGVDPSVRAQQLGLETFVRLREVLDEEKMLCQD